MRLVVLYNKCYTFTLTFTFASTLMDGVDLIVGESNAGPMNKLCNHKQTTGI